MLFSFANPENERAVADALAPLGLPLSVSHRILPEFREYERASTIVANAYLAPRVGGYLAGLAANIEGSSGASRLEVMQSSGGVISASQAASEPVRTVLSGPAGGVVGAYKLARAAGFERILAFDMGGTSTDVSLVDETGFRIGNESSVAGIPLAVPMLDIHTAGAGGGSIARFDAGGMLRVGPESAGADPGPICYGTGTLPTVTDANLILGRLDSTSFLGGAIPLHLERTRRFMLEAKNAIATVEEFAGGILRVIETTMAKAIRVISIERGFDPRDFTLVAFGGGGPVHACSLARALRVPRVLIPALPGALSAVGILLADTIREYSRTVMLPADAALETYFVELEAVGAEDFRREGLAGESHRSVDLRYRGQGYELNVPFLAARWPLFSRAAPAAIRLCRSRACDGSGQRARPHDLALRAVHADTRAASGKQWRAGADRHAPRLVRRFIRFHRVYDRDCLLPETASPVQPSSPNTARPPSFRLATRSASTSWAISSSRCMDD